MPSEPDPSDEGRFEPSPWQRPRLSLTARLAARLLRLQPRHGPRIAGQIRRDPLDLPRWALTLAILLTMLLFLALLVVFFLPAEARADDDKTADPQGINFDTPTKDWYKGPVRYLITKPEIKSYKTLADKEDRRNFIDWFWKRRDIVPDTPTNEFRDRFELRVHESTRMFSETTKPGWKTDMGKIYILVGPPDEINRDMVAKSHRGIVTWVYRSPPFPDLPPNTVVGFAKEASGEYMLSSSPSVDSDVARGLQFKREKILGDSRQIIYGRDPALLDQGMPFTQGPLETMLIYGRMQQLPPAEEALFQTFVETREFYGAIPLDSQAEFYKASDGTTYATLTVGIKTTSVQYRSKGGRDVPEVAVFGKLISREAEGETYSLAGDSSFAESRGNETAGLSDLLVFQATGSFKPGRYLVILGVQDKVSQKVASYRKEIVIPDYSGAALTLSSITLGGTMEPEDYVESSAKPFHLGKFLLVPQADRQFRKSNTLNIYFQIYNPRPDPTGGSPRLAVRYVFEARDDLGNFTPFATYAIPESQGQVQGYSVPLEKWPAGEFRVRVEVGDLVASTTATGEATFAIIP